MQRDMEYPQADSLILIGDLSIDLRQRTVSVAAQPIHLSRKEFDMLSVLAKHPGWAYTKGQLLDAVWGSMADANEHAVETMIYWLRKKTRISQKVKIQTLVGYGYKLVVEDQ